MPGESWKQIEEAFRVWSFGIYYRRTFAAEQDPFMRFAKALMASTRPIRDRQAVMRWYEQHHERY